MDTQHEHSTKPRAATVGVMGGGFVGSAIILLRCDAIDVIVYDRVEDRCDPPGTSLQDLAACNVIFVAVPTPMRPDGSCHTGIVAAAVEEARGVARNAAIVVRSTVPPGTSASLGVMFMPEFLTEANFRADFADTRAWVVGTDEGVVAPHFQAVCDVISTAAAHRCVAGARVIRASTAEAEMAKYARNGFLATKVSFFNELACICDGAGIDYASVRGTMEPDARIGLGHTAVPGPDGLRGFGGTCFPKDMSALREFGGRWGVPTPILSAAIERNDTLDRPEQDWKAKVGRAVL